MKMGFCFFCFSSLFQWIDGLGPYAEETCSPSHNPVDDDDFDG